jgi:hypothetical protein
MRRGINMPQVLVLLVAVVIVADLVYRAWTLSR